jgi:hypothetical protein
VDDEPEVEGYEVVPRNRPAGKLPGTRS